MPGHEEDTVNKSLLLGAAFLLVNCKHFLIGLILIMIYYGSRYYYLLTFLFIIFFILTFFISRNTCTLKVPSAKVCVDVYAKKSIINRKRKTLQSVISYLDLLMFTFLA